MHQGEKLRGAPKWIQNVRRILPLRKQERFPSDLRAKLEHGFAMPSLHHQNHISLTAHITRELARLMCFQAHAMSYCNLTRN